MPYVSYKCELFPGTNINMGQVGTWGEMSCKLNIHVVCPLKLGLVSLNAWEDLVCLVVSKFGI